MTNTAPVHHRTPADPHDVGASLRKDLAAVRAAHERLRRVEGQAWRTYAARLDAIVDDMDQEIERRREALANERADRKAERREAVHAVVENAHRALDELRVQESLAGLELRDALGAGWAELTRAVDDLRASVRAALQSVAPSDDDAG